ncbi:MAG: hypothetical protein L0Z62_25460, partial [Gemmataceae bacterium]|nr:hypothetical protein [Gemmataceae bacterium]
MNDLRLWRLLLEGDLGAGDLVPLLLELAAVPLRERLPFLGLLPRTLGHDSPGVRSAAVACLSQAGGVLAWRQIVRALHDPEPAVRLAATAALRESAAGDPPRFVHALFHPDPAVRRAAALEPGSPLPSWYGLYLLPDPECGSELLARLDTHTPPARLVPLALDHLRHGLLSRVAARALLSAMSWQKCFDGLDGLPARSESQVGELLAWAAGTDGATCLQGDLPADALDEVFDLFWPAHEEGETEPKVGATFFERAMNGMFALEPAQMRRVVAALVTVAARRGHWNDWAAQLCSVFHPATLTYPWVPREQRQRAIRGLYVLGTRCPRLLDLEIRSLLDADVFWREPAQVVAADLPVCRLPTGR